MCVITGVYISIFDVLEESPVCSENKPFGIYNMQTLFFPLSKLISKICLIYRKTCLLNRMAFFFKCLEATAALMWLYINKMELNFLAKASLVSSNLCFGFCNLISSVRNEQLCMLCRSYTWMNIQIFFIFLKILCIVLSWCSIMGWTWPHPFFLSFADLFKYLLKTQTVIKQHRLLRSPRDRPVPQFVTLWVLVKSQKSQKLCENN